MDALGVIVTPGTNGFRESPDGMSPSSCFIVTPGPARSKEAPQHYGS